MTMRYSRRRAMQAAAVTAATAAIAQPATSARQATPASANAGQPTRDQVEFALGRLDDLIQNAMANTGVPGAAVAVVYQDEVVYERGFGVREVGKPEEVTPETVFQIASLSKAISSTLVAAVIGDGATTWDAVASDILPEFELSDPGWTAQVTLRDLFSHRSGLPAYAGDSLTGTFGYNRAESVHRLRLLPPSSSLRSAFAYINLGLSVAAFAAAAEAGQTWEDLADERLFAPLGMTSSSYRLANYLGQANKAAPHYRTDDGHWELGEVAESDPASPAGGVSTNVRDLTHWMRLQLGAGMFEGTEVVAVEPLMETRRPQILEGSPADPAEGPARFYGLGWRLHYDQLGRLNVHHIGDFSNGFRTGVSLLPEAGLGIVVLSNAWPNSLSDGIPKAFLELVDQGEVTEDWVSLLDQQTAAGIDAVRSMAPLPPGDPPAITPPLSLEAYAGTYTNNLFGEIVAREDGTNLVLELGPLPTLIPLRHWDRDVFTYPLPPSGAVLLGDMGVQFTIGPTGEATALAFGLPSVGPDGTAYFTRIATED